MKIFFKSISVILTLFSTVCWGDENDQALYKCSNGNSYIYYQKINNSGNYNGWYEITGLPCQSNSQINIFCKDSQLFTNFENKNYLISGINCSDFKLNVPPPSYPMYNSLINLNIN